jgi:hypothetical protein
MLQTIFGMLTKQTSKQENNHEQRFLQNEVHTMCTTIIPKSKEWIIINCVVNVEGTTFLGFYIFKGDYI